MTATVHAHNEKPNGEAAIGTIVITVNTADQVIRDPAGNIAFQGPAAVQLVAGEATFTLPASDDETLEPSGFTFTATEQLKHVAKSSYRSVDFQTVDGATLHLADLASSDEVALDPSYGANLNGLTARVVVLEEGGGGAEVVDATTTTKGIVELATNAEAINGTDLVRAVTPAGVAAAIDANVPDVPSVLGAYIGQVRGVTVQPAALPPVYGNELWALANFRAGYNTTVLAPSLPGNSTNQAITTLVYLGNLVNRDRAYRLSGTVTDTPTAGWAQVTIAVVDAGGTLIPGTTRQVLMTNAATATQGAINWDFEFDFSSGGWGNGDTYLDVTVQIYNNASSGTVALANMSLKSIAVPLRPMRYLGSGPGIGPAIYVPLLDPVSNTWRMAKHALASDGALTLTPLNNLDGYNTERPFQYDPADPAFLAPTASVGDPVNTPPEALVAGEVSRSLRFQNNDQILNVKKADNSYELRGNVHGGETNRTAAVVEVDKHGTGAWTAWNMTGAILRIARKIRVTWPTQLQRSDAGSPFANVDHVSTLFGDGMTRTDRTTTFLANQRVNTLFEWMSSHDNATPQVGRIGNGLIVLDEVDIFPKVATPAVPSNTPSTSGGTLAAGTRYYAVTALAEGGETTAGPTVSATNTGSASSNALSWAAVSGATGYKVYRGASPTTLVHIATVAPIASPVYTDTGAAGLGTAPPSVNRARRLDATSTVLDSAVSDRASWGVWYDPILNMCFGNIFDRDSVASRPNVAAVTVRLEQGSGIHKNYINVWFASDGLDLANDRTNGEDAPSRLFTTGTVWTATHWSYTYVPADPVNYHLEIAARATDLAELKAAYSAA